MTKQPIFETGKYKFYYYPGQYVVLTQEYAAYMGGGSISTVKSTYTLDQLQSLVELITKLQSLNLNPLEALAKDILGTTK